MAVKDLQGSNHLASHRLHIGVVEYFVALERNNNFAGHCRRIVIKKDGTQMVRYLPTFPDTLDNIVIFACLFMLAGIISIWAIEYLASRKPLINK